MKYFSLAGFFFSNALLIGITSAACATASQNDSPNSGMRSVSVDVQSDNAHNRQSLANLSLTVGEYWWMHLGAGKNKSESNSTISTDDINTTQINPGVGIATKHWQATLDYTSRQDGDNFKQRDWSTSIGWYNEHLGIGVDGMKRSTETQIPVTGQLGRTTRTVGESLGGSGIGMHLDVHLAERLDLFAGAMTYHYGDVSTNRPTLSRLLYLGGSGITRDQALLDRTYHLGATYQFDPVAFTAQYINDRALDSTDVTHTAQFSATASIGKHWTLTPLIGLSNSDTNGHVTFDGLYLSYAW